jgi:hypothetical protein
MACNHDHSFDESQTQALSRRAFVQEAGAGAMALMCGGATLPVIAIAQKGRTSPAPIQNRPPLAPQPFMPLPLGAIKPAGWLRTQLEIQANGLSGHLGEVWPDAGDSAWRGGNGEAWERGPYYLDGLVPLAWLLDSGTLQAQALQFIEWTLASQAPSGQFGPVSKDASMARGLAWPRMVMLKALTQYQEVTGDPRVVPFMTRYCHYQLQELPARPLVDWGRARWQDEIVSLVWLYNRTGDPKLIELGKLLQKQGLDWRGAFEHFQFKERITYRDFYLASDDTRHAFHGVNNAMALKASAVWSLISRDPSDLEALRHQIELLDRYHGLPTGIFSADEELAGRSPSQGTELCTVVEAMYSLEQALAISGDAALGDRLERIAYNALPATLTDDMWAHQYDQQPNQIECSLSPGPWAVNGNEANLFGLEPNFGCCTANFHQGWPKLTASLWMASSDGGIAAMVYAPCEVSTRVRDVAVRLSVQTQYPFRDQVSVTVDPERPLAFPLRLRIPGSARGMKIEVNGKLATFHHKEGFAVIERTWQKGDRIDVALDFETCAVRGFNQSVSIQHGALLFALPIGTRWQKLREHGLGSADWEAYPTSAWNYAIEDNTRLERREAPLSSVPFSSSQPAVTVVARAQPLPQWSAEGTYAAPPPQSPVTSRGGATQEVTLIPYGAAKLRITSFPTVKT